MLTEQGCPACNSAFAHLIEEFVNKDSILIVITATGTRVDISPFLSDSINNIYLDKENDFGRITDSGNSFAIFLAGRSIDTIIQFTAENVEMKSELIIFKLQNNISR